MVVAKQLGMDLWPIDAVEVVVEMPLAIFNDSVEIPTWTTSAIIAMALAVSTWVALVEALIVAATLIALTTKTLIVEDETNSFSMLLKAEEVAAK